LTRYAKRALWEQLEQMEEEGLPGEGTQVTQEAATDLDDLGTSTQAEDTPACDSKRTLPKSQPDQLEIRID
jgi:hypothetical protein